MGWCLRGEYILPPSALLINQGRSDLIMDLKTTDLYLTAYLLSQKLNPIQILSEGQNRKKIIFVFPASNRIYELVDNFKLGSATVNILDFRNNFEYVRDLMFSKLREG